MTVSSLFDAVLVVLCRFPLAVSFITAESQLFFELLNLDNVVVPFSFDLLLHYHEIFASL